MKTSGFKKKYSSLKSSSGFKKSRSSLRPFREVKGELLDGEEVWQVGEADRVFSLEIRKRDGQCVNCGSSLFLGCSHYFGRGIYATRYDPENCVTLCQECHDVWEKAKDGIYKDFMLMWLGPERFLALEERAKEKISPYESIVSFMKISFRSVEESNNQINY